MTHLSKAVNSIGLTSDHVGVPERAEERIHLDFIAEMGNFRINCLRKRCEYLSNFNCTVVSIAHAQ